MNDDTQLIEELLEARARLLTRMRGIESALMAFGVPLNDVAQPAARAGARRRQTQRKPEGGYTQEAYLVAKRRGQVTAEELAKEVNCARDIATGRLARAVELGLLERVEVPGPGHRRVAFRVPVQQAPSLVIAGGPDA